MVFVSPRRSFYRLVSRSEAPELPIPIFCTLSNFSKMKIREKRFILATFKGYLFAKLPNLGHVEIL